MSEHAVLNANYLRHRIMRNHDDTAKGKPPMPKDGAPADVVKHEFTLDMTPVKDATGVTAKDVAKRLLITDTWLAPFPPDCPRVPDAGTN